MPSQQNQRKRRQAMERSQDRDSRGVAGHGAARFCRVSARKARLVTDMVKGMRVGEALTTLKFTHRPSAGPIVERLIKNVRDSVNTHDHPHPEELFISKVHVDDAGMLKRYQPRAFGRAARIRKRMCHITMELTARR